MVQSKNCHECNERICRLQCASYSSEPVDQAVDKKRYKRRTVHASVNIDGAVVETYGVVEDSRK